MNAMDLRCYDSLLDPIIVITGDGVIKYLNPSAVRWLAVPPDLGIAGKNIADFVVFSGADVFNAMAQLKEYASTSYMQTHFVLPSRSYEGLAKICVTRLPGGDPCFAVIVRDRAYIKTLLEEDDVNMPAAANDGDWDTAKMTLPDGFNKDTVVMDNVLDSMTITKALPHERTAKFNAMVSIVFTDLKKASAGKAILITDDWIEVIIRPMDGLSDGMNVNLEVAGNAQVRSFSTVGKLARIKPYDADLQLRIEFGTMSPLSRKALTEFLDVHALKIG